MRGERVEHPGNLARDAGAHEDVVHAGEHRAVERGEVGELDLREEVDADRPVVPFLGEAHLDERGEHRELLARACRHALPVHRQQLVGVPGGTPVGQEVALERVRRHLGDGEAAPSRGACARRGRRPAAGAPAPFDRGA